MLRMCTGVFFWGGRGRLFFWRRGEEEEFIVPPIIPPSHEIAKNIYILIGNKTEKEPK